MNAVMVTLAGLGMTTGAVYSPVLSIVPTVVLPPFTPLTCHVTFVSLVFATMAVNCCCAPSCTFAVAGEIVTVGGGGVGLPPPPQAESVHRHIAAKAARV